MPKLMTDERTRDTFAALRADELSHLRPPGAMRVHRTVRRRRTRRVVLGTGMAAVVVAAAGSFLPDRSPGDDRASRPPAAGSAGEPVGSTDTAGTSPGLAALLLHRDRSARSPDTLMTTASGSLAGVSTADVGTSRALATYRLKFVCVGTTTGAALVTLAVGTWTDELPGRCVPAGDGRGVIELTRQAARTGDRITVRVDPGGLHGTASYAYEVSVMRDTD